MKCATAATPPGGHAQGPRPFTVFAPTDEAFAKVPRAQLYALLADKVRLTKVLTCHLVPGAAMAKDVKRGEVKTFEGSNLAPATTGGATVSGVKVVAADVKASNGVIHEIDTVLMHE